MRKVRLVIFFIFFVADQNYAQFIYSDSLLIQHEALTWYTPNEYRKPIFLNGEWQYKINEKDSWQKTIIPSITDFQGEITFKKTFDIDSSYDNHHFKLICYGINYYCNIFINEQFIGSHAGGYTSFALDVPQNLIIVGSANKIEIKVKTEINLKTSIPLKNQLLGQKYYGGIIRDIYLIASPELKIEITGIDYTFSENYHSADIQVSLDLRSQSLKYKADSQNKLWYNIELWEAASTKPIIKELIPIDDEPVAITSTSAKLILKGPRLWSPEHPDLYTLKVYLLNGNQIIDATSQSVGLKEFKIIDNNFYLNGQRLILKGINWYEDYTAFDTFLQPRLLKQYLDYVKELKANAVRVAGHPPHPFWVDLCDRYGLLLLEEVPLRWVPPARFKSEQFLTRVKEYLTEVITRDKNHVSVLAWGIGGYYDSSSINILNDLEDVARQLDSRPTYYHGADLWSNNSALNSQITGIDVFDINKNLLEKRIIVDQSAMIVSSFGRSIKLSQSDVTDPVVPQEMQAVKIVEDWNSIQKNDKIDGYFLNSLSDWQCEYPLLIYGIRSDSDIFPSGVIDYNGNKRLAFNAIRSLYSEGKTRTNPGLTVKFEHPGIFPLIGVISLLIFLFIYHTRRYFRENLKRIFVHAHGFYVDLRDKRKVPVSHTILIAILTSLGLGMVASTFCYFYRENIFFDHLLTLLSINPSLKQDLIIVCWKPEIAIPVFSLCFFIKFAIIALLIKFFAIIFRKKLPLSQSLTLSYWIGVIYLPLVLVGMVLYRILLISSLFHPVLILLALFSLWYLARFIMAIKVIYVWTKFRSMLFVMTIIIILAFGVIYYYQQNHGILDYFNFYVDHLLKMRFNE